jgi:twitching motility protein PilU
MTDDTYLTSMHDLLRQMLSKNASDLIITAEAPPSMKIDGNITPVTDIPLSQEDTSALARSIMNEKQRAEFASSKELNFAIAPRDIGRFRVNAFVQQLSVGLVIRVIASEVPSFEKIKVPPVIHDLALTKRGLIILVGSTGSGKSTTLAALVNHRNENSRGHIITVEDPVEYVHKHKKCIITHREVGIDTESWDVALKNTLRQAPDVILMGEIRDRETMEHAMEFAETGHLCLATLHANNANQAIDRIVNFFPEDRHQQLFLDLSLNMRALISQRLVPRKEGKGRTAAIEILINTPLVSDLVAKGDVAEIKEAMKRSREHGMQTFDQHLFDLYETGEISYDDALRFADSTNDVRLDIKLNSKRTDRGLDGENSGFSLMPV